MNERFLSDPGFLDNTDSYIWCYASWMMKNYLNHENNMYQKKITDLAETDKGDIQLAGHYPQPERTAVRSEAHGIAEQMPEPYRVIYHGTIQGYEPQELAAIMGISPWALKWRKRNMVEILKQAWHTPVRDRSHIIRKIDMWPSASSVS